jgi:glycosyltransferase involved in cell wall biosynthesis
MQCQWLTGLPAAFVQRKVAALDRVTFASKYLLDEFVRAFPELQPKTATIHNGVDVSLFRPDETRVVTSDGITRVLFVGRVSPEKGVHCLLQAWGRLGAESHRMSLRIVGPFGVQPPAFFIGEWSPQEPPVDIALFNDNVYSRYLDDLRRTSGSNIEVIGNMPHRRLPRVYQQSDVFVFPSVWPEPFGLPLVEASATGLGIAALGGGSVSEIISDGHSGIVVEGNDDQALCEAIRQLADDGELRKKFGLEARARMESAFTWRHVARDMIDKLG